MEAIRDALLDASTSRVIVEGPHKSGRTQTVMQAVSACQGLPLDALGDWVISVGCENIGILKSLIGFSSVATYSRPGSFRIVIIDDADELLDNRGTCRQVLAFLASLQSSGPRRTLKAVLVMLPDHRRHQTTYRRLRSSECCDVIVNQVANNTFPEAHLRTVNQVVEDAVLRKHGLSGEDISYLVGMRCDSYDILNDRIAKARSSKQKPDTSADAALSSTILDAMCLDKAAALGFDDASSVMSSTIKVLAMVNFLRATRGSRRG